MGYILHNAIVVTSWKSELIIEAASVAEKTGLQVIGPSDEVVNGYRSLLICPDGSKEGWEESNAGNDRREYFKKWMNKQRNKDGSSAIEWVEIAYGSDDKTAAIVDSAFEEMI